MVSHRAKKPAANSPHSDISILKRAANSPVQHHNLPQTHLMPLQLRFFFAFWNWQLPLQHPAAAPGLLCRALILRAGTLTARAPGILQHFPKTIPQLSLRESLRAIGHDMTCCGHSHHHSAGTSFPFCHLPAHFFTQNYFQVSASVLPPQQLFAFKQPLGSFIPGVPS